VSTDLAITGSRTSGKFPGLEELVHLSSLGKDTGTSLYLSGLYIAGSTERISQRTSFCFLLEKLESPPKMMFVGEKTPPSSKEIQV